MRKIVWCSTENFNLTPASQLVSWLNNSTLFNFFVKIVVTFPFYIFEIFNLVNFEFVGFGTKWFLTHWVLNNHALTVVFFSETILLDSPSAHCASDKMICLIFYYLAVFVVRYSAFHTNGENIDVAEAWQKVLAIDF